MNAPTVDGFDSTIKWAVSISTNIMKYPNINTIQIRLTNPFLRPRCHKSSNFFFFFELLNLIV